MGVTTVIRLSPQERAIQEATKRTGQSMSLALKDATVSAIKSKLDRPTPFMTRPGAYKAGKPTVVGGVIVSTFSIAPIPSGALRFQFFGGDRKPGDAGTAKDKMFLPVSGNPASRNQCGGVPRGFIKRQLAKRITTEGAKTKAGDGRYSKGGTFFGEAKVHGRDVWGVWQRGARPKAKPKA